MAKGKVTQVIGTVVDIEFPQGELPNIYNAITINQDGTKIGTMVPMIKSNTAPANMTPNNLNENDKIFANSEINSKNPTRKSMNPKKGFVKMFKTLKNLVR